MIARFAIVFFFVMVLIVVPVLLSLPLRIFFPWKTCRRAAIAIAVVIWGIVGYGTFIGFGKMQVRHITFSSKDLPASFDGYRVLQFSDAHVGTMTGRWKWLMARAVDSIMAQKADMIVFTGDIQNLSPRELTEHMAQLKRLNARDGVFSVLGNHDYAIYQRADSLTKLKAVRLTQRMERQAGWNLLMNEHKIVRRDSDSIVVAGMENWGASERMPRIGDVSQTLRGVDSTAFILMLQHDPTAWRKKILPLSHAQLTLSGHTHGGQMTIFGWSPVQIIYDEWGGMTYDGQRAIHVSTGLGGLIPFRFGLPGEIVVVTLRKE